MDIKMHSGARVARERAQSVKALAAKTKDLSLITEPTCWKGRRCPLISTHAQRHASSSYTFT